MTVALTKNFLANARGLTLKDSAQVTWSIDKNTNEITAAAAGALGGTVTSVGLADGSTTPIYSITGSPVTVSGTLTFTLATQAPGKVFAGPTTGPNAQPTFRSLVAGDIPALAYVTSVGLADGSTAPIYSISGSPVTAAGTLTFTLATQAANLVFAGPTTGAAAQPTFRALVAADVPSSILPGSFSGLANPTAVVGLSAVNGAATTAMRSDEAPALDQTIAPTWTAIHKFTATGGGLSSAVELIAAAPSMLFQNTGGAANGKNWDFGSPSSTTLRLRALDDAGSTFRNVLQVTRSGVGLTAIEYANTTDNPTHKFWGKVGVNGVAPPTQVTGWGTPTGTGVVLNFAGASAPLATCSQAIAQIITDLKNFGLYGA